MPARAKVKAPPPKSKTSKWSEFVALVEYFEKHPITKLIAGAAAAFSIVVLYMTYQQISVDLEDRRDERNARAEEKIDRAWSRLKEPVGGDTNKGWALEVLLRNNIDTRGIDLSCRATGGFDSAKNVCREPPVYARLSLGSFVDGKVPSLVEHSIRVGDLTDAKFSQGKMNGISLDTNGMVRTEFDRMSFVGSVIFSDGLETDNVAGSPAFRDSDLSFSKFIGTSATIYESNVSGLIAADIEPNFASDGEGSNSWAWADLPPRIRSNVTEQVVDGIEMILLCDPSERLGDVGHAPFQHFEQQIAVSSATGSTPNNLASGCNSISVAQARERFPLAYETTSLLDWNPSGAK